jgi:hypothetical protein
MLFTCSKAVTAASRTFPSALFGSLTTGVPAAPLAKPMTVSLVEVSPSTVIWLKLACQEREEE